MYVCRYVCMYILQSHDAYNSVFKTINQTRTHFVLAENSGTLNKPGSKAFILSTGGRRSAMLHNNRTDEHNTQLKSAPIYPPSPVPPRRRRPGPLVFAVGYTSSWSRAIISGNSKGGWVQKLDCQKK